MRKHDGTSKNYGFVTFDDEMSVEKCLVEEHSLNGRKIEVRRAHPRDGGEGRDRSDRGESQGRLICARDGRVLMF